MAEAITIDGSATALRIAEQESETTLGSSPTWYNLEPESYPNDFGGQLSLVQRNIISDARQNEKGVPVGLAAAAGFTQDLTFTNQSFLWEGLFFADFARKPTSNVTAVTAGGYTVPGSIEDDIEDNALIFASGFSNAANNGLKLVTSTTSGSVNVSGLVVEASPPAGAQIKVVGHQFADNDIAVAKTANNLPQLVATTQSFVPFGISQGEFIFVGDDATANRFDNAENNGFARVAAITATTLTLDKTSGGANGQTEMQTEGSSGKTIRIFFADFIKNYRVGASLFQRRAYTIERSLGVPNPDSAPSVVQSQVVENCIVNTFSMNVQAAAKLETTWAFLGLTAPNRSGASGQERLSATVGSVGSYAGANVYNTSRDFTRRRLSVLRPTQGGASELAAPVPLFAAVENLTLNITNNLTANNAVGVFGSFSITSGNFGIAGNAQAYFASIDAINAVLEGADVTFDLATVSDFGQGVEQRKTALVWDMPLVTLGDGRPTVANNQPIRIPLELSGDRYPPFDHSLSLHEFYYLPDFAAQGV